MTFHLSEQRHLFIQGNPNKSGNNKHLLFISQQIRKSDATFCSENFPTKQQIFVIGWENSEQESEITNICYLLGKPEQKPEQNVRK